ncbi:four helix bundle protein [Echinicola vietnamensis]
MVFCSKLPKTREYNAYENQLIRCSSSVGANYRAAQRAKSTADFLNKL